MKAVDSVDPRFRSIKTHWDLSGLFMVLAVSELLVRSACLIKPGIIPWAWALGFILAVAVPQGITLKKFPLNASATSTMLLLFPLLGVMTPHVVEAFALPEGKGVALMLNSLEQLVGYLLGSVPTVSNNLQLLGLNGICFLSTLLFVWIKESRNRCKVLAVIMFFGAVRWSQYIPEIDGALMLVALAWCFSAAMEGVPEGVARDVTPYKGRLAVSLFITVGVFASSGLLMALFPLESLNRWAGSWVPNQDVFRNEYTKYGQSGFQLEDTQWYPLRTRLGGAVTLEKLPVMQVYTSRPGLYLRGMVKTRYTGQTWEAGAMELEPADKQAVVNGSGPFILKVHPFNNRDLTVFAPLHTDNVVAEDRDVLRGSDELYRLGFKWFPPQMSAYRVEGFSEAGEISPLLQEEPYLQLPEISSALKLRTAEIAGNGTDSDKMERLRDWLRNNGAYRLDVETPSETRDFVEQFVLGSREGYCTYFATALAVMGRISGVPTRYVEGYLLPYQTSGRQTYTVTSDRAHAWVEAYLEGEGWVAYEPTPTFGNDIGGIIGQAVTKEQILPVEPLRISQGIQAGKDNAVPVWNIKILVAVALVALLLAVARILWVEHSWRKGASGPRGEIWTLYALLSVLTLMVPEIKRLDTPTEKLKAAASNFPLRALSSHDIIKDTNQLLYGEDGMGASIFKELLLEMWQEYSHRRGFWRYLYSRYGSLTLFNSYDSLIRHRHFRKENNHGADQPHTSPQS